MANCWVTGGKCPHGFEGGILEARMSFCIECSQFSLNREETEGKLRDLWIADDVIISETDQLEICEHAEEIGILMVGKITNLETAIRRGSIKVGDKEDVDREITTWGSLKDIFFNLNQ